MMIGKMVVGAALGLGVSMSASLASAQEASKASSTEEGHASGLMVQARLQGQGGLLSLGGGSGFLLGYQGPSYAVGLGLGFNRVGVSAGSDASGSLTLMQLMPTALVDVWRSKDGRARANLIGGIGYGRGSLSGTTSKTTCVFDGLGNETCSTRAEDAEASITFLPVMVGFGGDYYLGRNFALGAELGLQAAFSLGLDTSQDGVSRSVDGSGNLQVAYGALRATFVLGD